MDYFLCSFIPKIWLNILGYNNYVNTIWGAMQQSMTFQKLMSKATILVYMFDCFSIETYGQDFM